jgi:hypothetical protein
MSVEAGRSVFAPGDVSGRQIPVFDGFEREIFAKVKDLDASLQVGRITGALDHFVVQPDGTWERLPDFPCTW